MHNIHQGNFHQYLFKQFCPTVALHTILVSYIGVELYFFFYTGVKEAYASVKMPYVWAQRIKPLHFTLFMFLPFV